MTVPGAGAITIGLAVLLTGCTGAPDPDSFRHLNLSAAATVDRESELAAAAEVDPDITAALAAVQIDNHAAHRICTVTLLAQSGTTDVGWLNCIVGDVRLATPARWDGEDVTVPNPQNTVTTEAFLNTLPAEAGAIVRDWRDAVLND